MGELEVAEPTRRRAPFGVWAVAILSIVLWSLLLLDLTGIRTSASHTLIYQALGANRAVDVVVGVIAILGIVSAVAMLRLIPAGFVATIVLAGVGLVNALASQFAGQGDDLRLALVVGAVLYLNQPAVRAAFGRGEPGPSAPTPRGAEGE